MLEGFELKERNLPVFPLLVYRFVVVKEVAATDWRGIFATESVGVGWQLIRTIVRVFCQVEEEPRILTAAGVRRRSLCC